MALVSSLASPDLGEPQFLGVENWAVNVSLGGCRVMSWLIGVICNKGEGPDWMSSCSSASGE